MPLSHFKASHITELKWHAHILCSLDIAIQKFAVNKIFLINTFTQQWCIQLVKIHSKDIYNALKDFYFK